MKCIKSSRFSIFLSRVFVFSLISILMISCGGGGGAGGTAVSASGSTSSASSSGVSAVSIQFNGLYARSYGSVWDTIDYLDLKIFVDGAEAFSKHLTASDNIVLVEHLTPGSTAYATGSLKYNEMNGGDTASIQSDTITLERGSNTLTLNVVYTYVLMYCGKDDNWYEKSGTYTVAGGIPLPTDFSNHDEYNKPFAFWTIQDTDPLETYPMDLAGIRGNVSLFAEYREAPGTFNITYHFERNGQTISNADAKVYTYMPAMGDFENYPYTCDIKCVIDSEVPLTDCYLDAVGGYSPVNPDRIEGEENSIRFYTSANTDLSEGTYVVKSNDGRTSAQTITIYKVDTIAVNGNTMSFTEFDSNATDLRYVINSSEITYINPDSVTPRIRDFLTYLKLTGTCITEIPASCFEDCSALISVYLPGTLNKVYKSAFKGVPGPFFFDSNPTSSGSIQFNVDATDATESSFVTNVSGYWNSVEYIWRTNNAWE